MAPTASASLNMTSNGISKISRVACRSPEGTFAAKAMAGKGRIRVVADPCIGLSDLLGCVERFLDHVQDNNLHKLLEPPSGFSWKSTPSPSYLAKLRPLWLEFLAIAPNGVLPAKRTRLALERLQERRNCNKTQKTNEEYAELCDEWMRVGLAHLRSLKGNELNKARAFRKADAEEQAALTEILDCIQLGDAPIAQDDSQQSTQESHALVPVEAEASRPRPAAPSAKPVPHIVLGDLGAVFKRVLERPGLGSSSSPQKPSVPDPRVRSCKPGVSGFVQGLVQMGIVEADEASIISEVQGQRPINHGFTSQLQRANKAKKKRKQEAAEEEDLPEDQDAEDE